MKRKIDWPNISDPHRLSLCASALLSSGLFITVQRCRGGKDQTSSGDLLQQPAICSGNYQEQAEERLKVHILHSGTNIKRTIRTGLCTEVGVLQLLPSALLAPFNWDLCSHWGSCCVMKEQVWKWALPGMESTGHCRLAHLRLELRSVSCILLFRLKVTTTPH